MAEKKNTLWDQLVLTAQVVTLLGTLVLTIEQVQQMAKRNKLLNQSNNEKS
jgi:hypothetical protein